MESGSTPFTGLVWTSSQPMCPKGYNMIVATVEGASANFVKGFNQKSAVYLSYSTNPESLEQVITDVQVLSEKAALPVGYAFIGEYIDPKVNMSKKKRLCVKLMPINTAESAVCDIKLTMKNKPMGAQYFRIGDISGLAIWCKKTTVSAPKPTPKPRSISTSMKGLSVNDNSPAQPTAVYTPVVPKIGSRTTPSENTIYDSSHLYSISAIDGIPFTIHPMFENQITNPSVRSSKFQNLKIKTLSEIENEYNYAFVVERTAAARLPPQVY
ncbi:multivesicular body subunit 12A [Rhinophrynus dorsalis]